MFYSLKNTIIFVHTFNPILSLSPQLLKEFLPGMLGSAYSDCYDRIPTQLLTMPPESISGKLAVGPPKGHIVFISSIASQAVSPGLTDYCASKAALSTMASALRMELNVLKMSDKITVTDFRPFVIDTGMFKGFRTR